jgi:excisionase family DNA binding protein
MEQLSTTGRLLLTVPEAAVALGIGRTLAYELVLRGELPSVKLGRARRIPVAALEAFVAKQTASRETVGDAR